MPSLKPAEKFRFREFELDVAAYELRRESRRVRLERRPMELLIVMVERRGELITRGEIVERLWGKDVFIEAETAVNTLVRKIRQALRDSPAAPTFIETVPGKGYRFVAPVEIVRPSAAGGATASRADADGPQVSATLAPMGPSHGSKRRRTAVLVAVLLVIGAVGLVWKAARSGATHVTLAVLPFEPINVPSDREYLVDSLHEETIAALGQIDPEHLQVIGRTSMLQYRGTTKSLAQIGRELGVEFLVETSVQVENAEVRLTPKLIRADDQVQVWSSPFNLGPQSMLDFQRELAAAVAEQISLRLSPDRLNALARRQTSDAEAYDLYLQGLYFWNQLKPETNRRAIEYYTRATERDPNYALAWAGMALVYAGAPINADAPPQAMWPRAREAAARAVRADSRLAETQTALGMVRFWLDWDWTGAEAAFRAAVDADPTYPLAHRMVGIVLSHKGRHEEARGPMQRLIALEPLYAMNHALAAQVAFNARDHTAALDLARRATVIAPHFYVGHYQLAMAAEQLGQPALAMKTLDDTLTAGNTNSKLHALRGYILAKTGRPGEARDVLGMLETVSRDRYVPPYAPALVHAGLGQHDEAFRWLERAYDAHDVHLVALPTDPKWDPLRSDPRFAALVARCGFAG